MAKQQRPRIFIYVFLLCVKCVESLEAPKGLKVMFLEPSGLYVEWDEVAYDLNDPITGYKIKLWVFDEKTTRTYKLLNGEQHPGLERYDSVVPLKAGRLWSNIASNGLVNYAIIDYIPPQTLFEIRVMAYKDKEIGPASAPKRIKLFKNIVFTALVQQSFDLCEATIITNKTSDVPVVYNSYL